MRRQIAQQALGIADVVIGIVQVEVMGEEVAVDPRDQVLIHVHEGHVPARHAHARDRHPAHQHPVAHQRNAQRQPLGGRALVIEIKQAHDEIAHRQPLQHPVEAHVREMEEREAVDDDAEDDEDDGPLRGMFRQHALWRSARQPRAESKHDRHPDDEGERGKDEVGGGEAVPFGVIHEPPRAGASVVVHHDHEGDGDAADHVEREQPLHTRLGCGGRIGHCWRSCRSGHTRAVSPRLGCP